MLTTASRCSRSIWCSRSRAGSLPPFVVPFEDRLQGQPARFHLRDQMPQCSPRSRYPRPQSLESLDPTGDRPDGRPQNLPLRGHLSSASPARRASDRRHSAMSRCKASARLLLPVIGIEASAMVDSRSSQLAMFASVARMMRSCRSGSIRRQPPHGEDGSALSRAVRIAPFPPSVCGEDRASAARLQKTSG